MKIETLYHVAGAVRPIDEVKTANASYEAGFLGSKIPHYTEYEQQLLDSGLVKSLPIYDRVFNQKSKHVTDVKLATEHFKRLNSHSKPDREAAAERPETLGLSKGAKVRHEKKHTKAIVRTTGTKTELDSRMGHESFDALYASTERNTARVLPLKHEKRPPFERKLSPISLQLQKRDWSGQMRAQIVTQTPAGNAPEANSGTRYTEKLTPKSVSNMFESGAYVAQCHEGFTTFLTLTFTPAKRHAIFGAMDEGIDADGPFTPVEFERDTGDLIPGKDGLYTRLPKQPFKIIKPLDTSIGRETSRFLDGSKKMFHRGWYTEDGDYVPGQLKAKPSPFGPDREKADFHYMWVAESPMNEDGEPNPHVHLLLKWTVDKKHFKDWAKRLESLWGHGMAHIERIRQPKAASTYLIKAVGYAAKGNNADQGLIKGNRYSIARVSRAPSWETLASFEADNITAVIRELGYKLEQWKKPLQRTISRINKQKAQTVKASSIAKQQGKPEDHLKKLQSRIIRLEHAAKKTTQEMKSRQMHASSGNRFSITFDGDEAKERMDKFLMWAAGARGWSMTCRDIDCSDLKQEADETYQAQYHHFLERRAYWRSVLGEPYIPEEPDEDEVSYWQSAKADYLEGRLQ
ncbi:rolling circle replication-associated protein [Vibrio crassostreae]|uniref:rolling circle replication-associated protein n=1 Tax=Vibrio crassostreae TaxID=246167 RepID=UPI0040676240